MRHFMSRRISSADRPHESRRPGAGRIYSVVFSVAAVVVIGTVLRPDQHMAIPSASTIMAQEAGTFRAHLPLVTRNVELPTEPPAPWQPDADFVLGGPAWAVDVVGDVAFVGVGAHLLAYDINGEDGMPLLGASPPLPGSVRDVVVRDGYAYLAVSQLRHIPEAPGGLFVLDVRDRTELSVVARRTWFGGATSVSIRGDRAVLASMDGWDSSYENTFLTLFDIKEPNNPQVTRWGGRGSTDPGDVMFVGEAVHICSDRLGTLDPDGPPESWFPLDLREPCSAFALNDGGDLMITVSDSSTPDWSSPTIRIYSVTDPFEPVVIGETPLIDPDVEARFDEIDIHDVHVSGSSAVAIGYQTGVGGVRFEVDVSVPEAPVVVSSRFDVVAGLGLDGDEDRLVVAGVLDDADHQHWLSQLRKLTGLHPAGSQVSILRRDDDGALREKAAVDGPGTLLSTVECTGDTAYVFEVRPWRERSGDILWALDFGSGYPEAIASTVLPLELQVLDEGAARVAVDHHGLFATIDNRGGIETLSHYRVADSGFETVGPIDGGGMLAVGEGHLYVMTPQGSLSVYDISVSDGWSLLSSNDFEGALNGVYALVEHDDVLWVATSYRRPNVVTITLIDVSDPAAPTVMSSLEHEHAFRNGYHTLSEFEGQVWMLSSDEWGNAEIVRLTVDEDGLKPRISDSLATTFDYEDPLHHVYVFPFSFAALDNAAWFVSGGFLHGHGRVYAVERAGDEGLSLAVNRSAPAAVRAQSTDAFDTKSETTGGLSVAACGDRIFGTDLEGGLYGIDPERWLEGEWEASD